MIRLLARRTPRTTTTQPKENTVLLLSLSHPHPRSPSNLLLLLALVGFSGACSSAQDLPPPSACVRSSLNTQNLALGIGYDQLKEEIRGECIDFDPPPSASQDDGQYTTSTLEVIEDSKTLRRKMGLPAAASLNLGPFGDSAKSRFLQQTVFKHNAVYALVYTVVQNASQPISRIRLKEEAAALLRDDPELFYERCGDGYVHSVTKGGDWYGMLEIEASSWQDKQDLAACLRDKRLFWSAEGELEQAIRSVVGNKKIRVRSVERVGGEQASAECDTLPKLIERARAMPSLIAQHPVVVDASIFPYKRLPLRGDVRPVDTTEQRKVLEDLADRVLDEEDRRRTLEYALKDPALHKLYDQAAVRQARDDLDHNLNVLWQAARACQEDHKACQTPEQELKQITISSPALLYEEQGLQEKVKHVDYSWRKDLEPKDLELLVEEQVESVSLENAKVDPEHMRMLSRSSHLKKVRLRGDHVTDAVVQALRLPHLESLSIQYSHHLTDKSFEESDQWEHLKELTLVVNHGLTSAVLKRGWLWKKLTSLYLCSDEFTDDVLRHEAHWKNLTTLHLVGSGFSDQALRHADKWPNLTTLHLVGSGFGDRALRHADKWPSLTTLQLWGKGFGDQALRHAGKWPNLTTLHLVGSGFSDRALRHAGKWPNLIALQLEGEGFGDRALRHAGKWPNLTTLHLVGSGSTEEEKRLRRGSWKAERQGEKHGGLWSLLSFLLPDRDSTIKGRRSRSPLLQETQEEGCLSNQEEEGEDKADPLSRDSARSAGAKSSEAFGALGRPSR